MCVGFWDDWDHSGSWWANGRCCLPPHVLLAHSSQTPDRQPQPHLAKTFAVSFNNTTTQHNAAFLQQGRQYPRHAAVMPRLSRHHLSWQQTTSGALGWTPLLVHHFHWLCQVALSLLLLFPPFSTSPTAASPLSGGPWWLSSLQLASAAASISSVRSPPSGHGVSVLGTGGTPGVFCLPCVLLFSHRDLTEGHVFAAESQPKPKLVILGSGAHSSFSAGTFGLCVVGPNALLRSQDGAR